ncbi:MAG: hypothetical protein AB1333_03150 [Patescibacteria group bacterium]
MFKEYKEEINTDVVGEKNVSEITQEEKSETVVNEIGGFENIEPFPLRPEIKGLIQEFFTKKGFEVEEMTDRYVKVKSPSGRKMTIENKVAEMYIGKNI